MGLVSLLLAVIGLNLAASTGHLRREITKSGSHRDLVTTFEIPTSDIEIHDGARVECSVLFIETIPSGAYVDPYQLSSLRPYGGPDFLLKDVIDLEQAEFLSKEFQLHIYSNLTRLGDTWSSGYSVPIHLRYHAVSSESFNIIKFVNPDIFFRCFHIDTKMSYQGYKGSSVREIGALCGSSSSWLCDWTQLIVESNAEELQVNMPVGKEEHFLIVTVGTILATVLGCGFLIYKTVCSNVGYKLS